MDYRLALTVILTVALTTMLARWWWPDGLDPPGSTLADHATIPIVCGVVAARVSTLLFDHPGGLVNLREVMIIRGGTDFWIGVAAGVAAIGLTVRDRHAVFKRLALTAPFGLIAYGLYHVGCVIQDGCPGPPSSFGLVQNGIDQRVIPVGLIGGVVAVAVGASFMRRQPSTSPIITSAVILGVLVAIRSGVSLATPSLAGIPNRDQVLSLAAAAVAAGLLLYGRLEARHRPPVIGAGDRSPDDGTLPA